MLAGCYGAQRNGDGIPNTITAASRIGELSSLVPKKVPADEIMWQTSKITDMFTDSGRDRSNNAPSSGTTAEGLHFTRNGNYAARPQVAFREGARLSAAENTSIKSLPQAIQITTSALMTASAVTVLCQKDFMPAAPRMGNAMFPMYRTANQEIIAQATEMLEQAAVNAGVSLGQRVQQPCKRQYIQSSNGVQCGKVSHNASAYNECDRTYCSMECLRCGDEQWLGEQASGLVTTMREQTALPKAKAKAKGKAKAKAAANVKGKGKGAGKGDGKTAGKEEAKGMSKAKGATLMASRIGQTGTLGNTKLQCLNAKILLPTACFLQSDLVAPLLTTLGDITRNKLLMTGNAMEWDGRLDRKIGMKRPVWQRFTQEGGHLDPVYARIFAALFDLRSVIMREWMVYFVAVKVEPFLPNLQNMGTDPEYAPFTKFRKPAEGQGAYSFPLFEAALLDGMDPETFLCNNAENPSLDKNTFLFCAFIEMELKRRRDACTTACRNETAAPPVPVATANGACAPLQLGRSCTCGAMYLPSGPREQTAFADIPEEGITTHDERADAEIARHKNNDRTCIFATPFHWKGCDADGNRLMDLEAMGGSGQPDKGTKLSSMTQDSTDIQDYPPSAASGSSTQHGSGGGHAGTQHGNTTTAAGTHGTATGSLGTDETAAGGAAAHNAPSATAGSSQDTPAPQDDKERILESEVMRNTAPSTRPAAACAPLGGVPAAQDGVSYQDSTGQLRVAVPFRKKRNAQENQEESQRMAVVLEVRGEDRAATKDLDDEYKETSREWPAARMEKEGRLAPEARTKNARHKAKHSVNAAWGGPMIGGDADAPMMVEQARGPLVPGVDNFVDNRTSRTRASKRGGAQDLTRAQFRSDDVKGPPVQQVFSFTEPPAPRAMSGTRAPRERGDRKRRKHRHKTVHDQVQAEVINRATTRRLGTGHGANLAPRKRKSETPTSAATGHDAQQAERGDKEASSPKKPATSTRASTTSKAMPAMPPPALARPPPAMPPVTTQKGAQGNKDRRQTGDLGRGRASGSEQPRALNTIHGTVKAQMKTVTPQRSRSPRSTKVLTSERERSRRPQQPELPRAQGVRQTSQGVRLASSSKEQPSSASRRERHDSREPTATRGSTHAERQLSVNEQRAAAKKADRGPTLLDSQAERASRSARQEVKSSRDSSARRSPTADHSRHEARRAHDKSLHKDRAREAAPQVTRRDDTRQVRPDSPSRGRQRHTDEGRRR